MPLLRASVEKLGFKMSDVKIILGSHAHGDHMQADAMVKEMTGGAMVMAMEQDVPALKDMKRRAASRIRSTACSRTATR